MPVGGHHQRAPARICERWNLDVTHIFWLGIAIFPGSSAAVGLVPVGESPLAAQPSPTLRFRDIRVPDEELAAAVGVVRDCHQASTVGRELQQMDVT